MFNQITAGIALGFIGSFHCIGMCGPLALSLPIASENSAVKFLGTLIYNIGRVITYTFLGAIFGMVGRSFSVIGYQQGLSITMGILILVFLVFGKQLTQHRFNNEFIGNGLRYLRKLIGQLYFKRNLFSLWLIGLLNGLLPCGMVYMAIAGAIATGSIVQSMTLMAAFGLGTLPVMWAITFFGNYLSAGIRSHIRKAYPYVIAMVACLLILRGLGIGGHHLNPGMESISKERQACYKP